MKCSKVSCVAVWLFVSVATFGMVGCKKSGGAAPAVEETLIVSTTPTSGSLLLPQPLGSGLPLTISVTSAMPLEGVIVEIVAQQEFDNTTFYTKSVTNKQSSNNFVITNIPKGQACIATMVVTSISKPTNLWTGTFRFSGK